MGATQRAGANRLSCLLFERAFRRTLIRRRYAETVAQRLDLLQFLDDPPE